MNISIMGKPPIFWYETEQYVQIARKWDIIYQNLTETADPIYISQVRLTCIYVIGDLIAKSDWCIMAYTVM